MLGYQTIALLVLMSMLSMSCQTTPPPATRWDENEATLIWPSPPDPPRIQFIGEIKTAKDIELKKSGFGKGLKDFIFGKKNTNLVKPLAIAKNEENLLVVADPAIPTIHFFQMDEQEYYRPKKRPKHTLVSPVGVAVSNTNVYVADSVLQHILVFDVKGEYRKSIGEGILKRPIGLALSSNQQLLFVVDTLLNQVLTFDLDGNLLDHFAKRGTDFGEFNYPTYITVLPNDDLCISDSLNFRVQIFDARGNFKHSFGRAGDGAGTFSRPKGISSDSQGNIYVVDAAFENIQVFNNAGELLLAFGSPGTGLGEFSLPGGIFVDQNDRIWVADAFNHRIAVFQLLGRQTE